MIRSVFPSKSRAHWLRELRSSSLSEYGLEEDEGTRLANRGAHHVARVTRWPMLTLFPVQLMGQYIRVEESRPLVEAIEEKAGKDVKGRRMNDDERIGDSE